MRRLEMIEQMVWNWHVKYYCMCIIDIVGLFRLMVKLDIFRFIIQLGFLLAECPNSSASSRLFSTWHKVSLYPSPGA